MSLIVSKIHFRTKLCMVVVCVGLHGGFYFLRESLTIDFVLLKKTSFYSFHLYTMKLFT